MAPAALIPDGSVKTPSVFAGFGAVLGLISTVVIGAVLTLVFAATLAVVILTAAALFMLAAVAVRVGRMRGRPVRIDDGMVLEARKIGHRWVAYGWDRRAR